MEEILASIRKIIAEDSGEALVPKGDAAPTNDSRGPGDKETPASAVESAEPAQSVEAANAPATATAIVVTEAAAQNDPSNSTTEETSMSNSQAHPHDGIFSDKSRQAIDDAFADLDRATGPATTEAAAKTASLPSVDGNSVESVFERAVRGSVDPVLQGWMDSHQQDLLNAVKPMIREWMDEHFPALLEGAVREEVARVIRARGGR